MFTKDLLEKEAVSTYEELVGVRKQCAHDLANMTNERDIYMTINNLLDVHYDAIRHSENMYDKANGYYKPIFGTSLVFEDSKSAKLYDTLKEFFGDTKNDNEMLTIIQMIRAYANME